MVSPSGLVRVVVPASRLGRWRVEVRDVRMATGRGWGGLYEAMERTADRCASSPGLGEAAGEIRSICSTFRAVAAS